MCEPSVVYVRVAPRAGVYREVCVARLILVLWAWAEQWGGEAQAAEQPDEVEYETRRVLTELTALHATRYYFALIKLIPGQVGTSPLSKLHLGSYIHLSYRRLFLLIVPF